MSFKKWKNYFESNQNHFDWLRLDGNRELNEAEKNLICKSIQQFQKGENSEGKNLFRNSLQMNDDDYTEAIKLFIREEQRHAKALGDFMEREGIPKIKHHWVDGVFRGLRKMAGLETSVAVLLTAEIISAVFYKALMKATTSTSLRKICIQILKDEEMHLQFQSFALGNLYAGNNAIEKMMLRVFKNILMKGTIAVVWITQRKVLTGGDYTLASFYAETMSVFKRTDEMMLAVSLSGKTAAGYFGI